MRRSSVILIHLAFWAISFIVPCILVLTYKSQITGSLVFFQIVTQLYYAIVFYFIYLFIVPATLGSSKKMTRNIVIFIASVLFLWFIKIGKTIVIDHRFGLGLEKYNIYSSAYYLSDFINIVIYTLFAIFINISIKWYNERRQNAEMLLQEHRMELELLKTQLNPHFFFNTLNNIYSLVYKKSDEAPAALMKLADIMRYMLYDSKAEKVPLGKELEHLRNYLELEKLRLRDPEFVSFIAEGETSGYTIPPMLLLSFVENAFKHGKKRVPNPGIEIRLSAKGKRLRFTVTNFTLEKIPGTESSENGIGMQNTRRRLELLYPGCHDLRINRTSSKYTVSLEINC